jgi:hypothetical protein
LMGDKFSKKAMERYRKDGIPLKCTECVSGAEQAEREQAQARRNQKSSINERTDPNIEERRQCAGSCGKDLPQSSFNRNQWSKGDGKSRCCDCVELAVKEEATQQAKSREDKIALAKQKVDEAEKSSDPVKILAAESMLAALQAEKVTGLKPVKLSSGRGRGRGSARGGGRR